jgi:hypothetical protein
VAGAADTFLKISLAAALLVAAGSVGYYYSVYLPARDAQLDRERRFESALAETSRQAERARIAEEKRALEEKRIAEKEELQNRYQLCIASAEDNYSRNWAEQCKKVAGKAQADRTDCLAKGQPKSTCELIHPVSDASPNCTLQGGKVLNDRLQQSRDRCLQESRLGLQ